MRTIMTWCVACLLLGSTGARAQVTEAEWEQFKARFAAMSERLDALEAENRQLRASTGSSVRVEDLAATNAEVEKLKTQTSDASWAERIEWHGDFRYRYERIEQDGRDNRDRNRIRARPGLVAEVTDTTEVGFGLATGGDNPVSTNQTLGGGGSTKEIRLDLAYATWTGLENTAITGGKFANPLYRANKSQLLWDSDFRPEGVNVRWANDRFFAIGSYNFIESDSDNDDDAFWAIQLGATLEPFDSVKVTAAAAYLDIPTEGREALFDDDFFGNSSVVRDVDGDLVPVYAFDYNLINASLDFEFNVWDMPLFVFGDYVKNDDVDDYDTGYIVGVQLGKAKERGSWQVLYQYEDLEADAALGLVNDSNFAGGDTDGKGSRVSADYAIDNQWTVGATYFNNKRGMDLGDNVDYERLQLDTVFKY